MLIHRSLAHLPPFRNAVLTIGTFDGVHRGHQRLLQHIRLQAQQAQGESILLTFHPHPRSVVSAAQDLKLLSTLEEKCELLSHQHLDHLVIIPFTREFSEQSPEAYIEDFLWKNFKPARLVIGYDHRFGKNRTGNLEFLKQYSTNLGFTVEEIPAKTIDNITVSSTHIRHLLQQERDVSTAADYLGYDYALRGTVVKGKQLGRNIGFPTANVWVEDELKLIPANGVYVVEVQVRMQHYRAVLNIGTRPSIGEGNPLQIEAHIIDFNSDIYGEKIEIIFKKRLRNEQKFSSLAALTEQISRDKAAALSFFFGT